MWDIGLVLCFLCSGSLLSLEATMTDRGGMIKSSHRS